MSNIASRLRNLSILLVTLAGCSGGSRAQFQTHTPSTTGRAFAYRAAQSLAPCPPSVPVPGSTGMTGTLRVPSGQYPLTGAPVSLIGGNGAALASTTTDGCGRFSLPFSSPGSYRLDYGVRSLRGSMPITLGAAPGPLGLPGLSIPGVNIPNPLGGALASARQVEPKLDVSWFKAAVIHGSFDNVEKILERMGIPYDLYDSSALEDAQPYQHRMLFITCGSGYGGSGDKVSTALRGYVGSGGALYVSDLAMPYLKDAFPGAVNYESSARGDSGLRRSNVIDPGLQLALRGSPTLEINYDLGGWQRISANQPLTTLPLLRDTDTQEPAAVAFNYGIGLVQYTTFHNEAQNTEAVEAALQYIISRM